ncbi:MAG: decarboxylating NADP(+)-dependent phosphogluconate dehydrogenase [Chlamydiota bacterium]|nr:decarboxylating NADP(+)-dependent phosphogluconate dehydrogenase [Chlamydiota bacterium]
MGELGDVGVIGMAVMGQNIALNCQEHGHHTIVYNRTWDRTEAFLGGGGSQAGLTGADSLERLARSLKRPRKLLLMIRAGQGVDAVIEGLLPHLEVGDVIMDGGNSRYQDTERRYHALQERGIRFMGVGISGGEEGARHGPSIMPGGDRESWKIVAPLLQSIAAQAEDGTPCCQWMGEGGAGHYVKMVHNGIEYGDMQLICEGYQLLRHHYRLTPLQIADIFAQWNEGPLKSYLIEITEKILRVKESDGEALLDSVLDIAGQKGTGAWSGMEALELGVPLPMIGEAVFARSLSVHKEARQALSKRFPRPEIPPSLPLDEGIVALRDALYGAKVISYLQGFLLMQEAAEKNQWTLRYDHIALIWREGCIIRSQFLDRIAEAFSSNRELKSLLFDPYFSESVAGSEKGWRRMVVEGIGAGYPLPCMSSALNFFDGYRRDSLPTNLLQAQRDAFGAHTYERVDAPRGEAFHAEWLTTGQEERRY